jgi:hypothetical protein
MNKTDMSRTFQKAKYLRDQKGDTHTAANEEHFGVA